MKKVNEKEYRLLIDECSYEFLIDNLNFESTKKITNYYYDTENFYYHTNDITIRKLIIQYLNKNSCIKEVLNVKKKENSSNNFVESKEFFYKSMEELNGEFNDIKQICSNVVYRSIKKFNNYECSIDKLILDDEQIIYIIEIEFFDKAPNLYEIEFLENINVKGILKMGKRTITINNYLINRFLKFFPNNDIIYYQSYLDGHSHKNSDVDVYVISDFEKNTEVHNFKGLIFDVEYISRKRYMELLNKDILEMDELKLIHRINIGIKNYDFFIENNSIDIKDKLYEIYLKRGIACLDDSKQLINSNLHNYAFLSYTKALIYLSNAYCCKKNITLLKSKWLIERLELLKHIRNDSIAKNLLSLIYKNNYSKKNTINNVEYLYNLLAEMELSS